jgi:hypothetical protein
MSSRQLSFIDGHFVASYKNIDGKIIEKKFEKQSQDKIHKEIVKYWRVVDIILIKEKMSNN